MNYMCSSNNIPIMKRMYIKAQTMMLKASIHLAQHIALGGLDVINSKFGSIFCKNDAKFILHNCTLNMDF